MATQTEPAIAEPSKKRKIADSSLETRAAKKAREQEVGDAAISGAGDEQGAKEPVVVSDTLGSQGKIIPREAHSYYLTRLLFMSGGHVEGETRQDATLLAQPQPIGSKKKARRKKPPKGLKDRNVQKPPPSNIRQKLAPPRPWPSVPTSSNATGPRSARAEGNNMICITRKTTLGEYLRRCKKLVIEDG